MKVNPKELLDDLERVSPGLAPKEVIEQSTAFVFQDKCIYTFNDEIMVSTETDLDLECAVPSKELLDFLKKTPDSEITVEEKEGELLLKGRKVKAGITVYNEILLPFDEIKIPTAWDDIPKGTLDAMSKCIFSVGSDMSKPALTCVHLNKKHIEASDGFRLTRCTLKTKKGFTSESLIPSRSVSEIIKFDFKHYAFTEGWIHFTDLDTNQITFSCRLFDEDYPDLKDHLDVDGFELEFPDTIVDSLDRAGIFSKTEFSQDETITILLKNKKAVISGESDLGWIEETISVDCSFDGELEFQVNPKLLQDILPKLKTTIVGENSLKFVGDDFVHVVCLVDTTE